MEPISLMGLFVLTAKAGIAILSVVGVSSGVNWMNKKMFVGKKGDDSHDESESQYEKFNRRNIL